MKKLFLQTFGCQMNERDSEAVTGLFLGRGYALTPAPEEADVLLYNTCSVRDHAEQKVFGRMGHFKQLKAKRPELVVGILGCMAQEHAGDFFKKNPEIDLVCGTGNVSQTVDLVEEILDGRSSHRLAVDRIDDEYGLDGVNYRFDTIKAYVTIMKGCDHKCTYCIVPYTRGKEVSRNSESILKEIKDLETRGFKDVMLLGQNVNSYGKGLEEGVDFAGLLEKIQTHAPGIARLRFTTSHPKDAHERLYRAMRDLPMVCEHLHLPVQSGSNAVLRRMKREHTIEWYLGQIDAFRTLLPDAGLTTDLIVGFPGETEDDFQATKRLLETVEFDSAFIYQYSPRPQTPALRLVDDVSSEEKARRNHELLAVQKSISMRRNQRWVGRTAEVLFDGRARKGENRYVGRTREFKRVVASSPEDLTGTLRRVRIAATADDTLLGELL